MSFEYYVNSGGKRLRCGFTTGTCAALAASAAAQALLLGIRPSTVRIITPKGIPVETVPVNWSTTPTGSVSCGIIKDSGDDIDATAGAEIRAEVSFAPGPGIEIDGGTGVGRVTKPGLDQPVGNAAINSTPRRMITEAVRDVCAAASYEGGIKVIVSIPKGEEIAAKTFNPVLGITGGISVLGTSGIVAPMSLQALSDTMKVEISQAAAMGNTKLIVTPGNYGSDYIRLSGIDKLGVPIVKCSNFIGDALDYCGQYGFQQVLLVGHAGKFVKLAGGIMNTHSRFADCRTELFCAYAAAAGADTETCVSLLHAASSDACISILKEKSLYEKVMPALVDAADEHVQRRIAGAYEAGLILFSNEYGLLGETEKAKELLKQWQ